MREDTAAAGFGLPAPAATASVPPPTPTTARGESLHYDHDMAKNTRQRIRVFRRYLTPRFMVQAYYYWKFRAFVSGRAEVEISPHARLGKGCVISSFTKVKITGPFELGERVQIATGCFLGASQEGLYMGNDVLVGPNCCFLTGHYAYDRLDVPLKDQPFVAQRITVGSNVWVGANSVILGGTTIGDNVIVSANSVVAGDVPPNTIVLGNPAKVIFRRR